MPNPITLLCFLCFLTSIISSSSATKLIIANNCKHDIWPAILATAPHQTLNDGGFHLRTNQHVSIQAPTRWSGRIWARQGCRFSQTGTGSCQTGDCSNQLNCNGTGGNPPATLVQMTLGTPTNPMHYYDVSLVEGFNLPVAVVPVAAGCGVAACEADVNGWCPERLAVRREGAVVGCKSECLATGEDRYCCRGEYGSVETCETTPLAGLFKAVCPRAYSFAYDEAGGLRSCRAKSYLINFCPPN